MRHNSKMILACLIPIVIIFVLYFFGVSNKFVNLGSIVFMIIIHLWMMKEHSGEMNKGGNYY